ncbi:MAG: ATP phosphoribosyltransferase [Candidatus Bathyarchaeota archaeon]
MKKLKVAIPKGHLWDKTSNLLIQAGYELKITSERSYLILTNDSEVEMRIHRAQNISPLVEEGVYDVGITGFDWIVEYNADVVELLDLEFGRVDVVAAVPQSYGLSPGEDVFDRLVEKIKLEGRERIIVASEYENITRRFCDEKFKGFPYKFIRSYGATETFIDTADMIVECSETGTSLKENGWEVIFKIFSSTARVIANKKSLNDKWKRDKIEGFVILLTGAKDAENLKLVKMNVSQNALKNVLEILPSMKSPTISKLASEEAGYAVEVAVKKDEVVKLIPMLKKYGATDILELDIRKAVK